MDRFGNYTDEEIAAARRKSPKLDDTARSIEAGFEKLNGRLDEQDKWISEVEAKQNTARFGGTGSYGRDRLLAAIPDEFRNDIAQAEVLGFKGDLVERAATGAWWKLQMMALNFARQPGRVSPGELLVKADNIEKAWGFNPVLKTAIAEGTGGGLNVIATPVEAVLWRVIRDNTVIRPLATKIAMSSLTHQIPVENANVSAFIVPDTGTISDSMPTTTFAQQALTAKQFAGLATISNALFQDNIIGLNDYLFNSIGEAIGILEDQGALDGVNFTGIAVAPGVTTMFVSGTVTSGGNIPSYLDWTSLVYLAQQAQTRQNAAFFCLPNVTKNAIQLVDSTGQPIFKFGTATEAWRGTIIGYPVYEVSSLKTTQSDVGLSGTNFSSSTRIYFGPASKLLYGDVTGMTFEIDPYGLFTTIQSRVRVLKRTAILAPRGAFFSYMVGVKYLVLAVTLGLALLS